MGLSTTAHYQDWRERAAFSATTEDKFTAVWSELLRAYSLRFEDPASAFQVGRYRGLLRAYAVLSGDDESYIHRMVARASQELIAS